MLAALFAADATSERCLWREEWWWFIPLAGVAAALCVFAFLSLVSTYFYELPSVPTAAERKARKAAAETAALEGRANRRAGLEEILGELGQVSAQLKSELRWGERRGLFPNTAWAKNRHLVTGEARTLVENAYEQAHLLDQANLSDKPPELGKNETRERQEAKQLVDAAVEAVRQLRDEVAL